MDLKEFIKETIGGIIDASQELQSECEGKGVIINPPITLKERDIYEHENPDHRYRRIETIEFDVAVTAATETKGGGKVGLKILALGAGAEGHRALTNEEVSRVRFSIPVVLSPAAIEGRNRAAAKTATQETMKKLEARREWPVV